MILSRLEAALPSDLDNLDSSQRSKFYERLGPAVVANRDGSLTLRWTVGLEMGVIRCHKEKTSTR